MLKKNQLVLILLTLVLMLSVYFIRSPFGKNDDTDAGNVNNNPSEVVSGRLDQLKELRTVLTEERAAQVLSLDAIIADSSKTVEEIEAALSEKRYINSLTEKELLLEVEVMNKGYQDCFVHAGETGIDITVVSSDLSAKKANEIILMALTSFDMTTTNVSVKFQTVEEVMGTVK